MTGPAAPRRPSGGLEIETTEKAIRQGGDLAGGGISGSTSTQSANASYPLFAPATGHADGWNGFMNNTGTTPGTFHVYVICAPATSVTP